MVAWLLLAVDGHLIASSHAPRRPLSDVHHGAVPQSYQVDGPRPSTFLGSAPSRAVAFCSEGHDSAELHGRPCSPALPSDAVLLRYMYDGGTLSQGRLCTFSPAVEGTATCAEVLAALRADGVDLHRFYACAYWYDEEDDSEGGWLPLLPDDRDASTAGEAGSQIDLVARASEVSMPPPRRVRSWSYAPRGAPRRRRIDVKLFRRDAASVDEQSADAAAGPGGGALGRGGFFAIGIVGAKNEQNTGTLWRSAFQLGAAFIFTVGTRYKAQTTDTLKAHWRMPLFHMPDWNSFAQFAPWGATWVAIEMGGAPLESFKHPDRAIYLLGSEDTGLPKSVVQACHEHVRLPAERYESFNVAMAGSIVMYDRLAKARAQSTDEDGS
ncbi:hypothetical protein AB1Y20_017765 [Prymnesium parvum]|uniref:tRNA/rRNA methyltransferase SpoU type domain-containing protein n=1 Tax=Prymnesium parvum TaxID=97485 RepID=A0AB34JP25_PRYPA